VFLKTHRVLKDGKTHIYYSLCESLRVSRKRVLQRQVLHLGELNTTQFKSWQRTIERDEFWQRVLGEQVGAIPWEKVVELLAVNRLIAPRSELSIHEKWFPQTAMAALLKSDERVAEKDRLYRALDRMVEHKEALEEHLAQSWKDLFGASFDVLLYDLTSTYFEGEAQELDKAEQGYSHDHRP